MLLRGFGLPVVALGSVLYVACSGSTDAPIAAMSADAGVNDAAVPHTPDTPDAAKPVDECANGGATCSANASCTDLPEGYACQCNAGYEGDGKTCTDVDECATKTGTCDPVATCANTEGSFTCTCPAGTEDVKGDGTACAALGQTCAKAITIDPAALPTTLSGDTSFGQNHYSFAANQCPGVSGSAGAGSNDVAYSFTPTVTGAYKFTLTPSNFDGALYVTSNCDDVGTTCLGAVDETCTDCAESVTLNLTAGTTYYAIVDGSSDATNAAGAYTFSVKSSTSFEYPLSIDVSALLIHDTVVNRSGTGLDATQDSMDGSNYKFITRSAIQTLAPNEVTHALPDDAVFAADANHPALKLGWNDANDGPNSLIVKANESFTMTVPADNYSQLQIYATSTEGNSSVFCLLTYDDGTNETRVLTFLDWYSDPPGAGTFYVTDGLDRYGTASLDVARDPAIFGASLNPDPLKKLSSVKVTHDISSRSFVFYGATAW